MRARVLSFAFLTALAMVLSSSGAAQAAGAQTWYLGGDNTLVANRGSIPPPDADSGLSYLVPDGQSAIWEANEPASIDVPMGTDVFPYSIELRSVFVGFMHLEIGSTDCTGNGFVADGVTGAIPGSGAVIKTGSIAVTDMLVLTGRCLALKIVNDADAGTGDKRVRVIFSDADTYFMSPASDPGYPTPELGTLILMAAGAGAVVLVARRR